MPIGFQLPILMQPKVQAAIPNSAWKFLRQHVENNSNLPQEAKAFLAERIKLDIGPWDAPSGTIKSVSFDKDTQAIKISTSSGNSMIAESYYYLDSKAENSRSQTRDARTTPEIIARTPGRVVARDTGYLYRKGIGDTEAKADLIRNYGLSTDRSARVFNRPDAEIDSITEYPPDKDRIDRWVYVLHLKNTSTPRGDIPNISVSLNPDSKKEKLWEGIELAQTLFSQLDSRHTKNGQFTIEVDETSDGRWKVRGDVISNDRVKVSMLNAYAKLSDQEKQELTAFYDTSARIESLARRLFQPLFNLITDPAYRFYAVVQNVSELNEAMSSRYPFLVRY